MKSSTLMSLLSAFLAVLLGSVTTVRAQALSEADLGQIKFDQKLDARISPTLKFQDETGHSVQLSEYLGKKPIVLVLGYYRCPMLCTLVLNGLVESAADVKWSIGREFEVVCISIDPRETPAQAAAKKRSYVQRYGRSGAAAGWHFLIGNESSIRQLASEVGFHFAFDSASKEYAHPSGLVILTPSGKISGYLFGVIFPSKDLYESLQRASSNQVGSPLRQFILLCFHYNPITGKYSPAILTCLRLFSIGMLVGLVCLIGLLVRRSRAAKAHGSAGVSPASPNVPTRPLTPALSPSEGERENRRQSAEVSSTAGKVERSPWLLPRPFGRGEGRGEGSGGDVPEPSADTSDPKSSPLVNHPSRL